MDAKKGFTLIKLVVLIFIALVVVLISTPIILGVIAEAKKGSFKDAVYEIIDAAEADFENWKLAQEDVSDVVFDYTKGVESSSIGGRKLDFKGSAPSEGMVIVNSRGKVAMAVYNGKYCASKSYTDALIKISSMTLQQCEQNLKADKSGAKTPEITENMIPITWDGTNWIKANARNYIDSSRWYDYCEQQWANVALVSQNSRITYVNAKVGTIVQPIDVMAYLVWIPRFKYKLFNVSSDDINIQKIDIIFEDKTATKSVGETNGTYLTHPAFTFGSEEVNGIWVGKFETTGNATMPTIKPGLSSIRSQDISTQFEISKKFNIEKTYGLSPTNEAHMMQNTEWGAVAYLSQSSYGKYGNPSYTGAEGLEKVIWANPSSYQTGCAGESYNSDVTYDCHTYQTSNGIKASTTGNVYGIYDTVGGGWEYVMAAQYEMLESTNIQVDNSGFEPAEIDNANMSKYINKYTYGTTPNGQSAYTNRILGDATGETKGWASIANFPYAVEPWVLRGGLAGGTTGIYCLTNGNGGARGDATFRVVLLGQ